MDTGAWNGWGKDAHGTWRKAYGLTNQPSNRENRAAQQHTPPSELTPPSRSRNKAPIIAGAMGWEYPADLKQRARTQGRGTQAHGVDEWQRSRASAWLREKNSKGKKPKSGHKRT